MRKTTIADQARRIERRKAQLGLSEPVRVPANSGKYRKKSKRNLLRHLDDLARAQGRETPFKAAY